MLEIDKLTVRYRTAAGTVEALSSISFSVRRGTTLALVGESGSGKSTVALAAMGLLPREAYCPVGRILVEGQDVLTMGADARRRMRGSRIGLVFQDPFSVLNPGLRVGEQVAEGLIHHRGFDQVRALARAIELLDEVGIRNPAEVAQAYPHELSGGMRQRALIAGALAPEPEILILDEPTTALDVTIEAQILELLEGLRDRRGLTMLFISHNLGVVQRIANEVAVLYAGEIVETGRTGDVLRDPWHPYTKGLLASIPKLDRKGERLASIPGRLPDLRKLPDTCRFLARCPFATGSCDTLQPLLAQPPGRQVRCLRLESTREQRWPVESVGHASRSTDEVPVVVSVTELTKTFRLSGGRIRWRRGWPALESPFVNAVDRVSLEIRQGEVLGLVGESGSGKTTMGRAILRLIEPDRGQVSIDGQTIIGVAQADLLSVRRKAQIVFQNPDSSLNPRKTVLELLGRPIERFGLATRAEIPRRVRELLELVRLPAHYANRYAHQMSGGEKQRVGIARALATEPRFIVCDEPVSALDVSVQAAIVNLLSELRDRLGVAYLLISHDIAVVSHLADRIAVMHRGQLVEVDTADNIIRRPQHPYTKKLIAAVPLVHTD